MTRVRGVIAIVSLLAAGLTGISLRGQSGAAPAATDDAPAATATGARRQGQAKGTKADMPREITIEREVFSYTSGGRRDPFKSLMSSSDIRPLLSDLRLTAVAFDPAGSNSVAILRDSYTKQQYRIRVGQQLGRLRVTAIRQKAVQFSMEEFGFNRQETLLLTSSDTTKVRNP